MALTKTVPTRYVILIILGLLFVGSFVLLKRTISKVEIESTKQVTKVQNVNNFVDYLTSIDPSVKENGEIEQGFLSVKGKRIVLKGQEIQVFIYPSNELAESDIKSISPDGYTFDKTIVEWIEPPHFFRKDTTLVLYVGNNSEVLTILQKVLGDQFAGPKL